MNDPSIFTKGPQTFKFVVGIAGNPTSFDYEIVLTLIDPCDLTVLSVDTISDF